MCGIAGAIWNDPREAIDAEVLRAMIDSLRHRGPDDSGSYACEYHLRPPYEPMPGLAMGARRLAIIDVAGGHQPMCNEDKTIWVVANGEIYNFQDLRHRLEGAGHTFRTKCDTEAIVHLYEDEGPEFARHIVGMFAIAIWDSRERRLVLARDRLGQKPLVYRNESRRLLFASELKSILTVPGVPREIDPNALDEYLTFQYVPHPNTILRGVRKLPPAHYAVWRDGKMDVRAYWTPEWNREIALPDAEYQNRLRRALEESVRLRLQSEVPLGAFLSGGVDSSLIISLMQKATTEKVKTFSIGFSIPEYDESDYARRVAGYLGTQHHEFRVEPDAVEILPQLIRHFDEPFADSSAIPTWYVAQQTREHVTVALTGDGGDELFAGYPRYRAVRLGATIDRLPGWVRAAASARFWQRLPGARRKSALRRLKRFTAPLTLDPARRYLEWIAIFGETTRGRLYSESFLESLSDVDPFFFLSTAWQRVGRRDAVTAASIADLQTYLPCDLMTKVDIASMAHSLECRQPFLDHRVVELAVGMPLRLKYRRGRGKRILRETFGDAVPEFVWKRKKMGFGVPLDHWFRHELRDMARDVLLDPLTLSRGYFRPETIRSVLDEHVEARGDRADQIWALLVLELWHREWIDKIAAV